MRVMPDERQPELASGRLIAALDVVEISHRGVALEM